MSEIDDKLENMRKTSNQKLKVFYSLSKKGRIEEAGTALLEAIEYNNRILRMVNEEIQRISKDIPGLNKELKNKVSELNIPPNKPPQKKFLVIPKQQFMH